MFNFVNIMVISYQTNHHLDRSEEGKMSRNNDSSENSLIGSWYRRYPVQTYTLVLLESKSMLYGSLQAHKPQCMSQRVSSNCINYKSPNWDNLLREAANNSDKTSAFLENLVHFLDLLTIYPKPKRIQLVYVIKQKLILLLFPEILLGRY